eukprot:jgi/Botrbrau1/1350/Bobra.0063s0061.1
MTIDSTRSSPPTTPCMLPTTTRAASRSRTETETRGSRGTTCTAGWRDRGLGSATSTSCSAGGPSLESSAAGSRRPLRGSRAAHSGSGASLHGSRPGPRPRGLAPLTCGRSLRRLGRYSFSDPSIAHQQTSPSISSRPLRMFRASACPSSALPSSCHFQASWLWPFPWLVPPCWFLYC